MNKRPQKGEISKWVESLFEELFWSGTHLRIASGLRQVIPRHKTEIRKSNELWTFTYWAHIDSAVFRLCRIYDKTSWSLERLLITLRDNPLLYSKNEIKEALAKSNLPERLMPSFPEIDSNRPLKNRRILANTGWPEFF
ncbi:MAG: hypothetical protein HZA89_02835 [Verrucomicrobia bacterium]|nr:hypothetical protein [Verrucomicrobiota bacterium]